MLRSGASRSLARALTRSSIVKNAPLQLRPATQSRVLSFKPPTARLPVPYRPAIVSMVRHASASASGSNAAAAEAARMERLSHERLQPTPDAVSTTSSTRPSLERTSPSETEDEPDMMAGIRSDMHTIRETFNLQDVPREAMVVGLAGVIPYLATSMSTVFLAWDMNYTAHNGMGFIFDQKTAEMLLHIIEPLQIGYGAVLISFLGAIHWGLEWAKFGGNFGNKRYMIGIIAPAVAWPSILMPIEYALITQFLAFNWLYFVDAQAATRGMAPSWYGMYRFVLTFIVGAAIVASLIGRGQVVEMIGRPPNALAKVQALREDRDRYLAQEEEIKEENLAKEGADEEAGDDE